MPSNTTSADDTTTGAPDACAAPADAADADSDNIANKDDNCRCVANPNQLDFDANGVGNVCDVPFTFSVVSGAPPEFNHLATMASAGEQIAMCQFPVILPVLSGLIQVTLDDEGTGRVHAATIDFVSTPQLECDIPLIVNAKLVIQSLTFIGLNPFTVGFPFDVLDHNSGLVTGTTDVNHSMIGVGIIDVQESSNLQLAMLGESQLMDATGSLPVAVVTVVEANEEVTLEFDDTTHLLFQHVGMEDSFDFGLTGLTGKLRLRR